MTGERYTTTEDENRQIIEADKELTPDWTRSELTEFFDYLDNLRESGDCNMFGASAYLERAFNMPHRDAISVTGMWMRTFSHDKTTAQRAGEAHDG